MGAEEQWNSGYRGPVKQWVQRTRGAVGTEDQRNSGYRGPVEQWVQTLAKWLLEFLGIPRTEGVNFHGKFGLGIPNHNNSGSKNLEIPRNSQKEWNLGMFKNYWEF